MAISKIIKKTLRSLIRYQISKNQAGYIKKIMHKNQIQNSKMDGEDDFMQKWSTLTKVCDPSYFRCFSSYIMGVE